MGKNPVAPEPEVVGSTSGKFGAAMVVVAVGGEPLEEGRESIVGMAVAAGVVAARRVLGSMSEALRAAAVAAVVGRRSRKMLDQPGEVMLSLGWSFGRCVMVRIERMAVSSGAMTDGAEGAFESRVGAAAPRVAVVAGIAEVRVGIAA